MIRSEVTFALFSVNHPHVAFMCFCDSERFLANSVFPWCLSELFPVIPGHLGYTERHGKTFPAELKIVSHLISPWQTQMPCHIKSCEEPKGEKGVLPLSHIPR